MQRVLKNSHCFGLMLQSRRCEISWAAIGKERMGTLRMGTVSPIAGLDAWVATLLRCSVEKETREGHSQNEYRNSYQRMLKIATKPIIWNAREFVKHCFWGELRVEEDRLGSGEIIKEVMETSRTTINAWTLLSVRNAFILVNESRLWTHVTPPCGSMND